MTHNLRYNAIQKGGFKQLILLFFPLFFTTFSNYFYLFIEKLLLARFSMDAMEAAVNITYAYQIFQGTSLSLAMMAQVFVGRWFGEGNWKPIGSGIWQYIWFSILSSFLTLPLGVLYGNFYFSGTRFEADAWNYYIFNLLINFLFPMGMTLSCFYFGLGKTRLVLITTLASQIVKLGLAYWFIFGGGWVSPMGLMGGALSTLFAQMGYCLVLLAVFLNKNHRILYHTEAWKFNLKLFWECMHPGLIRALNRILIFTSWAATARLMSTRDADHLLVLSIGGTLFLFLPFIAESICQAQITVVSQILGLRDYGLLVKAFRSGTLLVFIVVALAAIPLLLFPEMIFSYLFPEFTLDITTVRSIFFGVWISFVFFTWNVVPVSYVFAFKDMNFSLLMGASSWLTCYGLMYLIMEVLNVPAKQFWVMLSLVHGITFLCYNCRVKWLLAKSDAPQII